MQCDSLSETLGSCRPWTNENLRDSLNTLNNLQLNLHSYQKSYKKHSIKTKAELPEIYLHKTMKHKTTEKSIIKLQRSKTRTLESTSKSRLMNGMCNRSVQINKQLQVSRSKAQVIKRGQKLANNKQNHQIATQREYPNSTLKSRCDFQSKVFLINFDEQNKYRMLRKRELHHIIFGQRQKIKKRQFTELR